MGISKNLANKIKSLLLLLRFRQLQLTSDSRHSDLQKEINVKQFELERTQMILDETANNLKQAKLEAEKFQSKSEVWKLWKNLLKSHFGNLIMKKLFTKAYFWFSRKWRNWYSWVVGLFVLYSCFPQSTQMEREQFQNFPSLVFKQEVVFYFQFGSSNHGHCFLIF